jgi:hypothetical protein
MEDMSNTASAPATEQRLARVFISYSRKDAVFADSLSRVIVLLQLFERLTNPPTPWSGSGAFLVEDSANLDTCEGAGTIGLELIETCGPVDAAILALGAGAMATGVGHVFKCLAPKAEVIACSPRARRRWLCPGEQIRRGDRPRRHDC